MTFRLPALGLLLAAGTGILPAQAPAATPADEDAAALMALLNTPVESASKRVQMAIESPQAVEVITADQIRASGAFRVIDVLRLATSVQVWDEDPDRANVTLRGVSPAGNPRTVQLLIDGVAMFNIVAAPIDWNGLPVPVDAIERIEIVRGPSSSLYGANAQTGVIAITTRRAHDGVSGSLRAGAAEHGMFREQAFIAYGGQELSVTAGASGSSEQNQAVPMAIVGSPGATAPGGNARHESQGFIRPEFTHDDTRLWLEVGSGSTGNYDQTSLNPATLAALAQFPGQCVTRNMVQLGWAQTWSPAFRTEVRGSRKTFDLTMGGIQAVPGSPASPTVVGLLEAVDPTLASRHDFYHDQIDQASLQFNWDPSNALHLVGGFDASKIDTGPDLTIGLPSAQSFSAAGGFLSVDWSVVPSVTLSAGARAANESLGGSSTSPRASVVWKLDDATVFRAGYFTSTRSPMVQEKYAAILGNPLVAFSEPQATGLGPEKAADWEAGFRRTFSRWSLDVTWFSMAFKDLISLTPTGAIQGGKPVEVYQNGANTYTDSGVEVGVTGELAAGWLLGFNAATASFKDPIFQTGNQADYSPNGNLNLWTRYRSGMFFVYAAAQHQASYTVETPIGANIVRQSLDATTQLHFNLGVEPLRGLALSVYGVNATKAATPTSNIALLNQFAIRNSMRELGLQAAYRF